MVHRLVPKRAPILLTAVGLAGAVVFLAWLGYRATLQWRGNAGAAAERRADEVTALLMSALTIDMHGAQQTVLLPFTEEELLLGTANDLASSVASAFARFPYPESFFVWRADASLLFSRTGRLPPWETTHFTNSTFPVVVSQNSMIPFQLAALARKWAAPRSSFALFHTTIEDTPYQVIARLYYDDAVRDRVVTVVAFTVNLEWVRHGYFPELIGQIERITGSAETTGPPEVSMAILDAKGDVVAENAAPITSFPSREKQFQLAFFNPSGVSVQQLLPLSLENWTVRVNTSGDSLLNAADRNANLTLLLILSGTVISLLGIALAAHSLDSRLELAEIKSDFVAMASHELKTPLASISLVAETLERRRYRSDDSIAEYGALLSKEARRLMRLVDNLLTFSRITSPTKTYSSCVLDVRESVADALETFQPQLQENNFSLHCDILNEPAMVRGDREAFTQAFETVIENAIKYSEENRAIEIRAWKAAGLANISIKDSGKGIAAQDVPHIFEKFFRGKNAASHGTGLGLSIARQIVEDHGGQIFVASTEGRGAIVQISLPVAEEFK